MAALWRWAAYLGRLAGGAPTTACAAGLFLAAFVSAASARAGFDSPGELLVLTGACHKRLPTQTAPQVARVGDFVQPGHRLTCEQPGILKFRLPASGYPVEVWMVPGFAYVVPRGRPGLRLEDNTRPGQTADGKGSNINGFRTVFDTAAPTTPPSDTAQQSELTASELHMADLAISIVSRYRHRLAQVERQKEMRRLLAQDSTGESEPFIQAPTEVARLNELREDETLLTALADAVKARANATMTELGRLAAMDTEEASSAARAQRLAVLSREQENLGLAEDTLEYAMYLHIAWVEQWSIWQSSGAIRNSSTDPVFSHRQSLEGLALSISKFRRVLMPADSGAAR